jgi:hypothetical protein
MRPHASRSLLYSGLPGLESYEIIAIVAGLPCCPLRIALLSPSTCHLRQRSREHPPEHSSTSTHRAALPSARFWMPILCGRSKPWQRRRTHTPARMAWRYAMCTELEHRMYMSGTKYASTAGYQNSANNNKRHTCVLCVPANGRCVSRSLDPIALG